MMRFLASFRRSNSTYEDGDHVQLNDMSSSLPRKNEENVIAEAEPESSADKKDASVAGQYTLIPSTSEFIHTLETEDEYARTHDSLWQRYFSSWRAGLIRAALTAGTALAVNTAVDVWMFTKYDTEHGSGVVMRDSCSRVHIADTGIHLALNIVSTCILGASNYCMQGVAAPTREEVDRAHAKTEYVEIGVQSFRNMRLIGWGRVVLWLLLGVTSVPFHLFFNSVFFTSSESNQYSISVVSSDFVNSTWTPTLENTNPNQFPQDNYPDPFDLHLFDRTDDGQAIVNALKDASSRSSSFTRMTPLECISDYSSSFLQTHSDLVIVSKTLNETNPLLWSRYPQRSLTLNTSGTNQDPFRWICSDTPILFEDYDNFNPRTDRCREEYAIAGSNSGGNWSVYGHPVSYCLSRETPDICQLQYQVWMMLAIVVFGLIKTCIMWWLVFHPGLRKNQYLRTMGDAIASFMRREDPHTRGMCLVPADQLKKGDWKEASEPQVYASRRLRLRNTVSRAEWYGTHGVALTAALIVSCALYFAITGSHDNAFDNALGVPNIQSLASFMRDDPSSSGIVPTLLVANIPQLGFSAIYLAYNNLYTKMLLGQEWDRFASPVPPSSSSEQDEQYQGNASANTKKGLRTSESPRGAQRTTRFLSLPTRYALPLLAYSSLLHWLLSQSFFLVRIDGRSAGPITSSTFSFLADSMSNDRSNVTISSSTRLDPHDRLTRLGYSNTGIVSVIAVSFFGILVTYFLGAFKRLESDAGLGDASNSAVISAACHSANSEPGMYLERVWWGDVSEQGRRRGGVVGGGDGDEEAVRHCAFTSGMARRPREGGLYR
ncbi:hypothetical protein K402DRAFT_460066 [Aulographum hederae CBS 113979]|uniref:DUF6536 domain-containing protein n=1 Tax=Aulographum hederae CBS 113979 TaxID=1176131 RepID=A0A6G1HBL8_9PEZI|nr:hypothetical protein K402DRAFT_460066 [Aulographum hederae CBS 113979]